MNKTLKYIRRTLAALIGGIILLYFIDFTGTLPNGLHALLHAQLVPALLGGSLGILAVLLVLTLLLGRVYCSVICPLGILQDFILRCKLWSLRLRKRGKRIRTRYERPYNILRYGILGAAALAFALGSSFLMLALDPYSNFGRISVALFKPVVVWGNNLLASAMNAAGNYSFYQVTLHNQTLLTTLAAAAVLAILIVLVWRRERIWCNTVCPVGALLSLVSRWSLFRIAIDPGKCTHCKRCASACKARCIDAEQAEADMSRCVGCFNCLTSCNAGALRYAPAGWSRRKAPATADRPAAHLAAAGTPNTAPNFRPATPSPTGDEHPGTWAPPITPADAGTARDRTPRPAAPATAPGGLVHDPSRRRFIAGSLASIAVLPAALTPLASLASGKAPADYARRSLNPMPPGAIDAARFRRTCTACQLCISKCPSQVLKPALLENGLEGIMQPMMKFEPHSYCSFECNVCTQVCPNHALTPLTVEEKKRTQVGIVHFVREHCIVYAKDQDCGACAEHCPTQAVHMVAFRNGLTIPAITPGICVGCGACESICPVRPNAIFVEGLAVQAEAAPPEIKRSEEIEIDDFGF
ncbi:MAG: 4Fe-4S binding protein [Rikenellaceae bacterium]|nr:4Fe-4S binding protein [Rikenellaceae bacterium]